MTEPADLRRLERALRTALDELLDAMHPDGYWEGELSSSALATATAVSALAAGGRDRYAPLRRRGGEWLRAHQNADGGWGDSPESPSNLSTTLLGVAALTLCGDERDPAALARAEEYVTARAGRSAEDRIAAVTASYGKDRTFAVPILTNCAIAGLVPWDHIPALPFELAVFPHSWYRLLRLHVVSYALPALVAVGLVLHRRRPTRNPAARAARRLAEPRALRKLEAIQPESGGFLEAVPLTSFVAMSLAEAGLADHPVTRRGLEFLVRSARPDGSWPIDSNLSVWLTSNALLALDAARGLDRIDADKTRRWLAEQQHRTAHPYTNTPPGAWAWTHLPGGVPDADDTARSLLALEQTGGHEGAAAAVRWLLGVQNRDGGWPTFCRGWGRLAFDRSSPDLTAHALLALGAVREHYRTRRLNRAIRRGRDSLRRSQRPDGTWLPLWFGNQQAPDQQSPVLGTASVLPALFQLGERENPRRGIGYLIDTQDPGGGWGGAKGVAPSVEETALAVSALIDAPGSPEAHAAARRGIAYLLRRIEDDTWRRASPIGLYFSRLWYSERLYPIIWVVEALGKAVAKARTEPPRG